ACLEEANSIVRGLWSKPAFTIDGAIYRTDGATIEPRPERPIPIWLGTFAPRSLALTGRLADGWIPSLGYASSAELLAMRERVLDRKSTRLNSSHSQISYAVFCLKKKKKKNKKKTHTL